MEEQIIKNQKFKEDIVKVINESGLPAFIIKPTLKELFEQVSLLEEKQYLEAQANQRQTKKKAKKEAEKGEKNE